MGGLLQCWGHCTARGTSGQCMGEMQCGGGAKRRALQCIGILALPGGDALHGGGQHSAVGQCPAWSCQRHAARCSAKQGWQCSAMQCRGVSAVQCNSKQSCQCSARQCKARGLSARCNEGAVSAVRCNTGWLSVQGKAGCCHHTTPCCWALSVAHSKVQGAAIKAVPRVGCKAQSGGGGHCVALHCIALH